MDRQDEGTGTPDDQGLTSGLAPAGTVVHLVGRPTEAIFAFLGPATQALAESGLRQTVILIDDPAQRQVLTRFDPSVRLVLAPGDQGPLRGWVALLRLLCSEAQGSPVAAVHLHGAVACLIGVYAARFRGLPVPLCCSPNGSGLWPPLRLVAALVLWTVRPRLGAPARRTITTQAGELDALHKLTGQPVDLVEDSVASMFFSGPRTEARRPVIVTASRTEDPSSAARFAQLAVLLGEEALGVSFNWIGPVDRESLARLEAASVGLHDASDEIARVARLSAGWLYVATGSARGFPVCLVEAMAMGLPCVAWATPAHSEVIRHGETGLLCNSAAGLLEAVAGLVDSASARAALGRAAREEALRRFHRSSFRTSLLAAYQTPAAQSMWSIESARKPTARRRDNHPRWEPSRQ